MNLIDLTKADRALVMSCFDAMARVGRPSTPGEWALTRRERKRTMRQILRTASPELRRLLYQYLIVLTHMLGAGLPSLDAFPMPPQS